MLFNSLSFLFLFLPVALAGYYALGIFGARAAAAWLAVISLIFYGWSEPSLVLLLGASIGFNYLCGSWLLRLQEREVAQKRLLRVGVGVNLLALFICKYLAPIAHWASAHGLLAAHLGLMKIALPLGISFYTFTQIGYLVDCQAGIVKKTGFLDYLLFVTFFPHLIAGPIVHHREMLPQFSDRESYRFDWEKLVAGGMIVLVGLTKKVCLADPLISLVKPVFSAEAPVTMFEAWTGVLAYSLQLYFDFSGYSDMAIGLALMFGFRFPANFNSPYRAADIIEFWQRWHMSLTRYLTLYLYNPISLAMTRRLAARGIPIAGRALSAPWPFIATVIIPIIITMFLAGVWHGAGLQFVVFGLLHAFYLTVNHLWRSFGAKKKAGPSTAPARVPVGRLFWQVGLTYASVLVAQIFFRASSVHDGICLLQRMAGLRPTSHSGFVASPGPAALILHSVAILGLYAVVWLAPNTAEIFHRFRPTLSKISLESPFQLEWRPSFGWLCIAATLAIASMLNLMGATEFLYFRF